MCQAPRVLVCLFLACSAVLAQTSTAQISGTVKDETGSAIPGASVKATQAATGAVRSVTSGADGSYIIANLPIGPYALEVTKEGFSKFIQTGIVLQVDANPSIDIPLKVGSVNGDETRTLRRDSLSHRQKCGRKHINHGYECRNNYAARRSTILNRHKIEFFGERMRIRCEIGRVPLTVSLIRNETVLTAFAVRWKSEIE